MSTERTFVAVVQFGDVATDIGVVVQAGDTLTALWPDGCADAVRRDRRGWLWDEYGDDEYPIGRGLTERGTRLRVLSRRKAECAEWFALWDAASAEVAHG